MLPPQVSPVTQVATGVAATVPSSATANSPTVTPLMPGSPAVRMLSSFSSHQTVPEMVPATISTWAGQAGVLPLTGCPPGVFSTIAEGHST